MGDLRIEAWSRRWDRSRFRCGVPALDAWLAEQAGQAGRRDTARTHLVVSGVQVVGYFSFAVGRLDMPAVGLAGLTSRYPMSALVLARLAVDAEWQGRGIGSWILGEATIIADRILIDAAFQVFVVDAVSPDAAAFYARWGFVRFADDPLRLYLTAADIRSTAAAVRGNH